MTLIAGCTGTARPTASALWYVTGQRCVMGPESSGEYHGDAVKSPQGATGYFACTFVLDGTNIPFPPEYFGVESGTGGPDVGCCAGDCTSKTASNIEP